MNTSTHPTFKKNLNINILQGQYLQNISLFLQLLNLLIIFFYEWRQDTVIKHIQVSSTDLVTERKLAFFTIDRAITDTHEQKEKQQIFVYR